MKFLGIFLILFGMIVIIFPEVLAILIGGLFVVIGANILLFFVFKKKQQGASQEDYVQFGKYKIFR